MSDLDPNTGCDLCGDFPAELRAKCHPTAPLRLSMPEPGVLAIYCYLPDCNREVARMALAAEAPPETGHTALIQHVGCGDLDNMGKCPTCDAIRAMLRRMR